MRCKTCENHCCIGDYATFLTLHDAKRISESTGLPVDEFCFYGPICADKEGQEELMTHKDHTYFDFSDSGNVLQLKAKNNGACFFLDEKNDKKCTIYKPRPLICRIFPLWYRKVKDKIKLIIDDDCGNCWIISNQTIKDICKNLGYTEEEMNVLVKQFTKELEEYQNYEKDLTQLKPSEAITKQGI